MTIARRKETRRLTSVGRYQCPWSATSVKNYAVTDPFYQKIGRLRENSKEEKALLKPYLSNYFDVC